MALNDEQRAAVRALREWEIIRENSFFILDGAAGVGKTYTLSQSGLPFVYTAPTNKAVKVLANNGVPYPQTIHQLLGLKMMPDGAVRKLKQSRQKTLAGSIVVVDEASMLSTEILNYISQHAKRGARFIFLGDSCQLPPVNEANSPIWSLDCPRLTLTKQMRQSELAAISGLSEYLAVLRGDISMLPAQPMRQVAMPVRRLGNDEWLRTITANLEMIKAGQSKVIAWRNVRVDYYNKYIRSTIFGSATDEYILGDRVLLREPAYDPFDAKQMIAPTDTEGTIINIDMAIHPIGFALYKLTIQADDGELYTFYPIHPSGAKEYKKTLKAMAETAKRCPSSWGEFWELKETISEVAYAYAITAHKSQGSTYNVVYIDWHDIWTNRNRVEAGRCFYVAVSRARNQAFYGTITNKQ